MTEFHDLDYVSESFMGAIYFNGRGKATIMEASKPFDDISDARLTRCKTLDTSDFHFDDLPRNVQNLDDIKNNILAELSGLSDDAKAELLKSLTL